MKQLFLLAALICFGMAAIKFCTARMKPNNAAPKRRVDLSPEEAKARMEANPDLILLDVRTRFRQKSLCNIAVEHIVIAKKYRHTVQ